MRIGYFQNGKFIYRKSIFQIDIRTLVFGYYSIMQVIIIYIKKVKSLP